MRRDGIRSSHLEEGDLKGNKYIMAVNFCEKVEADDKEDDLDEVLDATDISAIIPPTRGQGR